MKNKVFNYYYEQVNSAPKTVTTLEKSAAIMSGLWAILVMAAFVTVIFPVGRTVALASLVLVIIASVPFAVISSKAISIESDRIFNARMSAFEKTGKRFKKSAPKAVLEIKKKTTFGKAKKFFEEHPLIKAFALFSNLAISAKLVIGVIACIFALFKYVDDDKQREIDAFYKYGLVFFDVEEDE